MMCVQYFSAVPPTICNNISFRSNLNKPLSSLSAHSCINPDYYSGALKFCLAKGSKCAASNDEVIQLPGGLDPELMPKHVAVIMDGNRRWARNRGLPVQLGHGAGRRALKQLALNCNKFGVKVLTVFAFSTENWIRPKEEVDFLMNLFEDLIQSDMDELIQNDVRVSVVGNVGGLRQSLQRLIRSSEERSKDNKGSHLLIALNYSGRYDITEATREIARKVRDGVLGSDVEGIDEALIEQHLQTNVVDSFPNPDFMIRTSGELRLSNFMMWQLAHAQLLFVDKLFPDVNEDDLVEALTIFQRRKKILDL